MDLSIYDLSDIDFKHPKLIISLIVLGVFIEFYIFSLL
jgi:hypothetical protein